LYVQKRGRLFKKNNERRYVREIRLIRLSVRLPQIRLMVKVRVRSMARIRVRIRARIMIN
jgi:hypothetical protein